METLTQELGRQPAEAGSRILGTLGAVARFLSFREQMTSPRSAQVMAGDAAQQRSEGHHHEPLEIHSSWVEAGRL